MDGSAVSYSTSCERIILGSADTESWEENSASPVLGLRVSRFVEIQVRENQNQGFGLGAEACGSKENAEESVSATEMQEPAPLSHGSEHFNTGASATEGKLEDAGPLSNMLAPNEKDPSQLHGVGVVSRALSWFSWTRGVAREASVLELSGPEASALQLLGAVCRGWIWCNTTVRKSWVGGITMLFTGYFTLCCSRSFWPLKVQHWGPPHPPSRPLCCCKCGSCDSACVLLLETPPGELGVSSFDS
ncbi:uncharacterized protein C17orf80-like [Marmota monax]|uniref:uncharacterized protein C17orf80-like n=1 Tax=Marmota monax TaxID=9995 RepID=UPI0026EACF5A|nr:uncharacterized protein C17orf80-like [Marmota monax]